MRALCIQRRVGVGTKSLILLIAPIPEVIFLDNLSMCVCHSRFSSINIPSDFTEVTFSIGTLLRDHPMTGKNIDHSETG